MADEQGSLDARLALLEKSIANLLAHKSNESWSAEQIKEYVEAVWREKDRAVGMAEAEREKAAQALRVEVERARQEGDDRLHEHIASQIAQIRNDLVSADKLEQARVDAVANRLEMLNSAGHKQIEDRISAVSAVAEQHVQQLRRERELVTSAQIEAISKAEAANEKRFESVNEFRAEARMVREQQQKDLAVIVQTFMPREVADAKFLEQAKALDALFSQKDLDMGRRDGIGASGGFVVAAVGVVATLLGAIIVLANVFTG